MRVCTEMEDVDFALDLLLHSKLLNFCLVEYFHSNFVPCDAVCRKFDLEVVRQFGMGKLQSLLNCLVIVLRFQESVG